MPQPRPFSQAHTCQSPLHSQVLLSSFPPCNPGTLTPVPPQAWNPESKPQCDLSAASSPSINPVSEVTFGIECRAVARLCTLVAFDRQMPGPVAAYITTTDSKQRESSQVQKKFKMRQVIIVWTSGQARVAAAKIEVPGKINQFTPLLLIYFNHLMTIA